MGTYKYYVVGFMSGVCATHQEYMYCKSFIGWVIQIIKFNRKYPQVTAQIRNGYGSCGDCVWKNDNLLCKGKIT